MDHNGARLISYLSLILGSASMLLFMIFLCIGSPGLFALDFTRNQALVFDGCLSVLFFIQHSVLVRRGMRDRLARRNPVAYFGAMYSIASGIMLIVVMALWQSVPPAVFTAGGAWYWALRALFVLSIAGFYWGSISLKSFDPFGVRAVKRHLTNRETRRLPLSAKGAYGWVRHPLYFFMMVMIWAFPEPTVDRLLFNVLWSAWIIIGTLLEERDLERDFGEDYLRYKERVPMIIPYRIPR